MKILFVTNMYPSKEYSYNGIHVKEQIEYLVSNNNINHQLYFINGLSSKWNYLKSIFIINKIILRSKFDLIHIHFGLSGLFLLMNPFINVPVILTIHGSDINSSKAFGFIKFITKIVASRVQHVIILNDQMAITLSRYKEKLVKAPCGININQFALERKNDTNYFLIGFPGDRKRAVKNYPLFEKIVSALRIEGYEIKTVDFHNLSRTEVAEKLSKLDCLLMTSHTEGSPQLIKEAMSSCIPIVSADVGDVSFLLRGVENCFVIKSYELQPYLESLLYLCNLEPTKRRTNGINKIKFLKLDQDSVCSKIFEIYDHAIKNKKIEKES